MNQSHIFDGYQDPYETLRENEIPLSCALAFFPRHIPTSDCWCLPELVDVEPDGCQRWVHRRTDN